MQVTWIREFPTEVGDYWFAGERYKRTSYCKDAGDKPRYELILCRVKAISNGVVVIGDGQFMYEEELGDEWFFAPALLPDMPAFSGI